MRSKFEDLQDNFDIPGSHTCIPGSIADHSKNLGQSNSHFIPVSPRRNTINLPGILPDRGQASYLTKASRYSLQMPRYCQV